MDHDRLEGWPAFVRELSGTLAAHSQYLLHGNVKDFFLIPGGDSRPDRLVSLPVLLWEALRLDGFLCLLVHDPVDGLQMLPVPASEEEPASLEPVRKLVQGLGDPPGELNTLLQNIKAVANEPNHRIGMLVTQVSRLAGRADDTTSAEHRFFLSCAKLAETSPLRRVSGIRPGPLYNPVIWLADRDTDLPGWVTTDNVRLRSIGVPVPDLHDRERAAALLTRRLNRLEKPSPRQLDEVVTAFATEAEGLPLQAMREITRLADDRGTGLARLPDAARVYKIGILDNPWRRGFMRDRIRNGEKALRGRVIGQERALTQTLDILKRAALGLSGAQAGSSADRPRGVLFFAGPTGVGKTELAKGIARLVFGDVSAYLRFDMSEFSAEHASDRLIGAPPGYVGHEAGGELTNAVRQRPLRVILFDEIEKAHERILDKFLQIIEDGRLTDGQGRTTYFSETVLVFTSNLGIQRRDADTGQSTTVVTPKSPYEEVRTLVGQGVREHFVDRLGRPELLNRLGGNIVIFDFIRPGPASIIFDGMLSKVLELVRAEHGVLLEVSDPVRETLREWCTADLEHGGRGIGNDLEALLINPLARALFDRDPVPGEQLTVNRIHREPPGVELL